MKIPVCKLNGLLPDCKSTRFIIFFNAYISFSFAFPTYSILVDSLHLKYRLFFRRVCQPRDVLLNIHINHLLQHNILSKKCFFWFIAVNFLSNCFCVFSNIFFRYFYFFSLLTDPDHALRIGCA